MHPLLSSRGRLALYLAAWLAVGGLLVWVVAAPGSLSWLEAVLTLAPALLAYAFACLSTWHLCRVFPVGKTHPATLMFVQLPAAVTLGGLWSGLLSIASMGWQRAGGFAGLEGRLEAHRPMLFGVGVLLALLAAALHYILLGAEASRAAEKRAVEARLAAQEAEIRALKAQINPHFLFNSLNSISALTSLDPSRARQMCVLLGEFLRQTLRLSQSGSVPLEDEMALARSYLGVEKVRFGDRFFVDEYIGAGCADILVPPLLLQPLVENAVKHGVSAAEGECRISLEARQWGGKLRLIVENTLEPGQAAKRRPGLGLANVRGRVHACYGDEARFEAGPRGGRFRVEILLPIERKPA